MLPASSRTHLSLTPATRPVPPSTKHCQPATTRRPQPTTPPASRPHTTTTAGRVRAPMTCLEHSSAIGLGFGWTPRATIPEAKPALLPIPRPRLPVRTSQSPRPTDRASPCSTRPSPLARKRPSPARGCAAHTTTVAARHRRQRSGLPGPCRHRPAFPQAAGSTEHRQQGERGQQGQGSEGAHGASLSVRWARACFDCCA